MHTAHESPGASSCTKVCWRHANPEAQFLYHTWQVDHTFVVTMTSPTKRELASVPCLLSATLRKLVILSDVFLSIADATASAIAPPRSQVPAHASAADQPSTPPTRSAPSLQQSVTTGATPVKHSKARAKSDPRLPHKSMRRRAIPTSAIHQPRRQEPPAERQ